MKVFLLGKGVEPEVKHPKYNVKEQVSQFIKAGEIHACGTCLKLRQMEGNETCPVSTMKDLYQIIKESEKVTR